MKTNFISKDSRINLYQWDCIPFNGVSSTNADIKMVVVYDHGGFPIAQMTFSNDVFDSILSMKPLNEEEFNVVNFAFRIKHLLIKKK